MTTTTTSLGLKDRIPEISTHVRAMLRLAVPIILARAGWMFLSFVDVLMVGRFSTDELAYMSLASSLISVAYVAMMGMMLGTLVITSNLFGQRRYSEIGAVWRRSLPYAFGLGSTIMILTLFAEPLLSMTGQAPEVSREAGEVIRIYGYGMPLGGLVYVTSQYFLEGIKRPVPAMVLILLANVINVGLNWVLIYGHLGFEAMGAAGSAWATTIIRMVITAGIIAYIWTMPGARIFGVRRKYTGGFRAWSEQRRLGYAAGLSFGIEHVSFVMLFLFAGLLGTLDLAAVTIVFNTFALFFMVSAGIASATAVQVGTAYGQCSGRNIALAGWTGLGLIVVLLVGPALLMVLTPALFAHVYTDDPALITLALPLYVLGGFALLLDTGQTLWSNALRGRHDKWFPTVSHFVSYIVLMIPLSWHFAFTSGHRGEGLFEAVIIASVVSVTLLTGRFIFLSWKDYQNPARFSGGRI
jgi:multidrug resistance protein, MATE family